MTDKITKKPEIQPPKVTNGHLTAKDSKRTITFTWGKYSITIICITAVAIAFIQKIQF